MNFLIIPLIAAAVFLLGHKNPEQPPLSSEVQVKVDPRLLKECVDLPKYAGSEDGKEVIIYIGTLANTYSDCAKDKKELNNFVKKTLKIPE